MSLRFSLVRTRNVVSRSAASRTALGRTALGRTALCRTALCRTVLCRTVLGRTAWVTASSALVWALLVAPAHAQCEDGLDGAPLSDCALQAWDHIEFTMGFMAGARRYDEQAFVLDGAAPDGEAIDPFTAEPFRDLPVFGGLRYDARLVVSYVRMTVGLDFPFPSPPQDFPVVTPSGAVRQVAVQSIQPIELRFGIGAEIPIGPLVPYLDLQGGVHWIDATVTIDGQPADYDATGFAFSARGGLRLHVRRWFFVAASGEVGFLGDIRWGADLSVGFALL